MQRRFSYPRHTSGMDLDMDYVTPCSRSLRSWALFISFTEEEMKAPGRERVRKGYTGGVAEPSAEPQGRPAAGSPLPYQGDSLSPAFSAHLLASRLALSVVGSPRPPRSSLFCFQEQWMFKFLYIGSLSWYWLTMGVLCHFQQTRLS